jgi:peroxiredoxin/outer membrane lipoprotein-sorting protein
MRALWRVILPLLCLAPSYGQASVDPRELLAQVAQTYRDAPAFHFVANETTLTTSGDLEREQRRRLVTANDTDGRWRVEVDGATQNGFGLSDGQWTWIYLPGSGKYTKQPVADSATDSAGAGPPLENLKSYFIARYSGIGADINGARLLREETLTMDARYRRCLVIEAEYASGAAGKMVRRFWIDPSRLVILREESVAERKGRAASGAVRITQTVSFDLAQLGEPLPNDLFSFEPAASARQVASFEESGEEGAGLIGQAAAAFELSDFDGNRYRLEDLQGKIVLLNFWATWCLPCRAELPLLEQLHQARGNQTRGQESLLVLGVNSEAAEEARKFAEEHSLTFASLADPENTLAHAYNVTSIPTTVVIGKNGKVAFYAVGAQTREQLRQALAGANGFP